MGLELKINHLFAENTYEEKFIISTEKTLSSESRQNIILMNDVAKCIASFKWRTMSVCCLCPVVKQRFQIYKEKCAKSGTSFASFVGGGSRTTVTYATVYDFSTATNFSRQRRKRNGERGLAKSITFYAESVRHEHNFRLHNVNSGSAVLKFHYVLYYTLWPLQHIMHCSHGPGPQAQTCAMLAISWEVEIKTSKTVIYSFTLCTYSDITHVVAERIP